MEDMPIWQNHEQRITVLETTVQGFSRKMDSLETTVKDESKEQKALLNRLVDYHLDTKRFKLSQLWKVILNIFGVGGLATAVIYAVVQLLI